MTIQCTTCRYLDIESNKTPCNRCGNFNMWETQEYRTVEELEKIKTNFEELANDKWNIQVGADKGLKLAIDVVEDRISELKEDNTQKSEPDDFHEYWDEMAISELKGGLK